MSLLRWAVCLGLVAGLCVNLGLAAGLVILWRRQNTMSDVVTDLAAAEEAEEASISDLRGRVDTLTTGLQAQIDALQQQVNSQPSNTALAGILAKLQAHKAELDAIAQPPPAA